MHTETIPKQCLDRHFVFDCGLAIGRRVRSGQAIQALKLEARGTELPSVFRPKGPYHFPIIGTADVRMALSCITARLVAHAVNDDGWTYWDGTSGKILVINTLRNSFDYP